LCLAAAAPGHPPREDTPVTIRTGMVPSGELGIPLGQLILLEGVRAEGPKYGSHTLNVEKIDGRKLASPMLASIDNVELPKAGRCAIRVYETMGMVGRAPAYRQLAKLKNEPPAPEPQAGWQVRCFFVALDVVEPASLKVNRRGT
jgi:hypothetical protein